MNNSPSGTTSRNLYWIYVLESKVDGNKYVGYTSSINQRLKEHTDGKVLSTKNRRPFELIYIEGCLDRSDANRREKYLKTTDGRRFLAKRLKTYYGKN
jgi:putative endonuclease